MTDRCPHDLAAVACVTCATPQQRRRRVPRTPGPTFTASFPGACPGCPFGISPGEDVRRYDDRYWHARCAEVATP